MVSGSVVDTRPQILRPLQRPCLELVDLLERPASERPLGMPERLFARLNQIVPGLVDRALLRHLPVIRRHARSSSISQPTSQGVNI